REWFRRLESGPAFARCDERAYWLADEHGLTHGYASAIVHEYERQRRLRLASARGLLARPGSGLTWIHSAPESSCESIITPCWPPCGPTAARSCRRSPPGWTTRDGC